jgi:autotransporter-associated beta strand protein
MKSKTPLKIVTGILLAANAISESRAVDRSWIVPPPDEGDFLVGLNWSPSFETGWDAADRAIVNNGGTAVLASGTTTLTELWVGNFSATSGSMRITGGDLFLTDGLVVGRQGATGVLTVNDSSGPTNLVTNFLRIGSTAAASTTAANATFTLSGAQTTLQSGTAGGFAGIGLASFAASGLSSTGVATISNGATWTHSGTVALLVGADNNTAGQNGGTGTLSVESGGSVILTAANMHLGRDANSVGTLNVNGGTVKLEGPTAFLNMSGLFPGGGTPTGGTSTINLSSGTIQASRIRILEGTGTLNLNGGTLIVGGFAKTTGVADVNLNGVTIQISELVAQLFDNFLESSIDLQAGGLTVDTNSFATTITQGLHGVGGLTKKGLDSLTLVGASDYTGATLVSGGVLSVTGAINGSSVTVGDLATLSLLNFNAIGDAQVLALLSGSMLSLDYIGTEIIGGLSIAGTNVAPGSYSVAQLQALAAGTGVTFGGDSLALLQVSPVPEPSTVILVLGALAVGVAWRLRRSVQSPKNA